MLLQDLRKNFDRLPAPTANGILRATEAMMRCASANTSTISRELSRMNNTDFKTSDMWLYRLISNKNFQLNDGFWRCYVRSIFQILTEQGLLKKSGEKLLIAIDFTSDRDDFLILFASLIIGDLSIPLYFSMRAYPKRKNQMNQKKMELAFIKALRHILSEKYRYIILADRGFGNDRFMQYCHDQAFDTMIRIEPNMAIKTDSKQGIASEILREDGVYSCTVKAWKKDYRILRQTQEDKTWFIATNMSEDNVLCEHDAYRKRFKIEKVFQGLKSGGFDIEQSKIKKYDRFKRMLFLCCFSYSMLALIGKFISDVFPDIKKNSPLCTAVLIASSGLAVSPCNTAQPRSTAS